MRNNFQRIKQMNIDELAVFLFAVQTDGCSHCSYYGGICNGKFFDTKSCVQGIKAFLSSEDDSTIRMLRLKLNAASSESARNSADFQRKIKKHIK